ncbi:NAD(P)H-dependent oxidoreductase [Pseudopedobacter beijingensis]|uniref:NAD(P)H-dependent oxidoreductase n=1 Tax=Pseudopedobacter beijingensis TaxID=1207056 RepID=A0ABW4IEG9_9SPHI
MKNILIMNSQEIIDKLNWRYATKKFDTSKKLTNEQLSNLLEVVQLSPSSFGVQPYRILVISDPDVRAKLRAAGSNQPQITDASQLFVFAVYDNFDSSHIEDYIHNIAATRETSRESLAGMEGVLKSIVNSKNKEELKNWNSRQAYIALGTLLESAALLGFDACPMEGFNNSEFDEILNLREKNLTSVVIAAVGFRDEDDKYQHYKKVRKHRKDLFIEI